MMGNTDGDPYCEGQHGVYTFSVSNRPLECSFSSRSSPGGNDRASFADCGSLIMIR